MRCVDEIRLYDYPQSNLRILEKSKFVHRFSYADRLFTDFHRKESIRERLHRLECLWHSLQFVLIGLVGSSAFRLFRYNTSINDYKCTVIFSMWIHFHREGKVNHREHKVNRRENKVRYRTNRVMFSVSGN